MNCPRCGQHNAEDQTLCEGCGAPLAQTAARQPSSPPGSKSAEHPGFDVTDDSEAPTVLDDGPVGGDAPALELQPGAKLGDRYEIQAVLGRGGMGVVYRARDLTLGRDVALKAIRPELMQQPEIGQRFRREILLASKITHKNILRIHDLGESDGLSYISMAYVEGETLGELLAREGPLSVERTLPLAIQLCQALEAAHEAGVVHRDLKPQNVLIDKEGTAYIADFGISRPIEGGDTMTQDGAVLGTLRYMAPEQARGETPDHRADIYSLGMVLYRTLIGQLPFDEETSVTGLLRRTQEDIPAMRKVRGDMPAWLSGIVARALARDPAERYQDAGRMRRDLESRHAARSWRGLFKPRNLGRAAAAVLAVAVVVAGVKLIGLRESSQTAAAPGVPRAALALLPFVNRTGDPSYDWVRAGLPDLLRTDLLQSKSLRVAEEGRVEQIFDGLKIDANTELRPATIQRVANLLGVDYVVTASFFRTGNQFRVESELQNIAGGSIVSSNPIHVAGRGEDSIFGMVDELSRKIRDDLGVSSGRGDDLGVTELSTQSVEALRLYGEALDLIRAGNDLEATKRLEQALEADEDFALARAVLAETFDRLGFGDRAQEQIDRAAQGLQRLSPYEAIRVRAIKAWLENDPETAEGAYRELTELSPNSARAFFELANVQEANWDLEGALQSIRRVLELDPKHANAQYALGRILAKNGDMAEALTVFQAAYANHMETGNRQGRADVANGMGNVFALSGQYDKAMTNYEEALEIREQIGDRPGVAAALGNLAERVYGPNGESDKAIRTMEQALTIYSEIGDKVAEAGAHSSLGDLLQASGRPDESLASYQESLKILRDVGDQESIAWTLGSMGYINMVLGNYPEAAIFMQQALAQHKELGDTLDVCVSLGDLGILEQIQGRYEKALKYYMDGLACAQSRGRPEMIIGFKANLANVHEDQGNYGAALKNLEECKASAREIEDQTLVATCLTYEGSTRRRLGDLQGSSVALDEARQLADMMDNHELLAKIFANRSALLEAQGDRGGATRVAGEAVVLADQARDFRLGLIARFHAGRATHSVQEVDSVAAQAEASDLLPLIAPARLALARIHLDAGRVGAALREAQLAIETADSLDQRDLSLQAHHVAGRALELQDDPQAALEHYRSALTALDQLRGSVDDVELEFLMGRPETTSYGEDAGELMTTLNSLEDAQRLRSMLGSPPTGS